MLQGIPVWCREGVIFGMCVSFHPPLYLPSLGAQDSVLICLHACFSSRYTQAVETLPPVGGDLADIMSLTLY